MEAPAARQIWWYRPGVQYALAAAVMAAIALFRLGAISLDDHEAKAALAGRAMIGSPEWLLPGPDGRSVPPDTPLNRWLVPVNNGRPRLVKTPLPYWCIAVVGLARGRVDEWTARLPAAISAVLCVLVALALGRRVFSPRAALMGALMLAATVGFQKWGRNARPEMMLCLFITVAMSCFYAGVTARGRAGRAGWMLAFWVAMGMANLAKQFLPLLLGLPLLTFVLWRAGDRAEQAAARPPGSARRDLAKFLLAFAAVVAANQLGATSVAGLWTRVGVSPTAGSLAVKALLVALPLAWLALRVRPWPDLARLVPVSIPGLVLMFAAFLPWMWYMRELFPQAGGVFNEQVAQRAAGTGKWVQSGPQYYLLPLVTLTLPWIGFLPGAFACPWMRRFSGNRHALMYLFLWSVGFIGLLTLSAGKREHYILPALPAVCLLMGFVAEDVFFEHRWIRGRLSRVLGMGYVAAGLAGPVGAAVLYGVSALGAGLIKQAIAEAEDPPRMLLRLGDSARWLHLLLVTAAAAGPMLAAWVAIRRRRSAPVFRLMLAAIVILYVGYHSAGELWDRRAQAADFARCAARTVPPDAPVANLGDPQAKTVFYFGRNIPNLYFLAGRATGDWNDGRSTPKYLMRNPGYTRFLKDPSNVPWLFCYGKHVKLVRPLGFEPVLRMRSEQKKQTVFMLLRNSAGVAPVESPSRGQTVRRPSTPDSQP